MTVGIPPVQIIQDESKALGAYGPGDTIFRFLDENGDGTGNMNANGNYGGANATEFIIKPPANQIFRLTRAVFQIVVTAVTPRADEYGDITLVVPVQLAVMRANTVLKDLFDGLGVLTNGEFARYTFQVLLTDFGAGLNYIGVEYDFTTSGKQLAIDGTRNERLAFILNDDFTPLVSHTVNVQGWIDQVGAATP